MFNKTFNSIISLSIIMAIRMLGLFMILPIFSVVATRLPSATPTLIGITLGIYGLTQALTQAPLGILSDYVGRKPVIFGGLVIFALGSVVAAMSQDIYGILIGRALQGAGAVGSAILAMVADVTPDEHHTKAMAIIGFTIGIAFIVSFIFGPIINAWFHWQGIFWLCAALSALGMLLLYTTVPNTSIIPRKKIEIRPKLIKETLKNPQLLRLDFGIFSLHAILTALFIGIPIMLTEKIKIPESRQILLYLLTLIIAFLIAVPCIRIAEKRRLLKEFFISSILIVACAAFGLLFFSNSIIMFSCTLLVFFTAFTFLEASLPSWIAKISPLYTKGSAMGVYSTCQFLGIFVGGSLGGFIYTHYSWNSLLLFCAALGLIWGFLSMKLTHPPYLSRLTFKFPDQDLEQLDRRIKTLPGVSDILIEPDEKRIHVRIDRKIINEDELHKCIEKGNLLTGQI